MFGKFICFISLFFIGCSSCAPSLSGPGDTSDTNISEDYPFATWEACSQNIGDHPCNFELEDQSGNLVNLYDFYGDTIVIDFSVMWCGPCSVAASEVQEVKDAFSKDGFTYLTVLIEDSSGNDPTSNDCKNWADNYGITEPVLAGDRSMLDSTSVHGWSVSAWPTFFFITDEMILNTKLQGFSSSYIDSLIKDTMGE
jgi:hypothetical protein